MAATQDNIAPPPPRGFSPYVDTTPPPPRGFTPYVEEKDAPTVTRQTVSQGPAPLAPGVSTIDDGRSLIGRETAAPPPNVAASTRTIKEGEPTAEELAIASQPYRGPIIRRRPAPVAPVVNKPEPKEPLIYKTRVEALDDAVNLLEMNQNLADVVKHFASLGVTQDEIESHAKARNSEYVQPRVPTAPSGRYSLTNAKLQKTPSVADEIERLYSEGKPGEALKLAAQDEIKTYAKVFKTAGANLGDQATSVLTTIGAMTPEEASFRIRENATARARNAPSDAVQKGMMEIKDAKTYGAVVEKMWEHPVATITMMAESVLTSLPTSAPSLLLGPAGAGVRAAAALVGSGTSEYASTMTDVLQDQKIDLRDVEQVAKALRDPKILAEIKDKGLKRGLIVGVFDGITMGLAGRFLSPVRELIREGNLVGNAARKATIGAWSKELALQVTGSVSGEVLAQKAVGEDKKAAVVLEALVSLPTSPLEVMSTFGKGPTPGETIGNALREQVARGSFTEEGIQNEVRNSLDPGRQQASNIPNRPTLEVPTKQFGSPVAKNEIPPEQPPEQKSTQTPVTSLNKEDEYVNEEDLFAPPTNVEAPVVANFADRATTAADKFESAVVEQFGLTQEQAKSALATLMYIDAVKLDPLSGQFTLTNGQFWAKEIMLKAAETGANLPKLPAATTTAAPILEAPAPQKTIAEILGGTNQEAAPAAEIKEEVPAADTPVTPTEEPSITEVAPPAAPSEQHKLEAIPTVYPLVSKLTLSQDVPQFKGNANASGVVKPLGGLFNTTGLAPIQVWRRLNGDLEVISGRHRLDLAKRSGVVTIPSQIHNEADGFTKKHAAILDAELNIQDEQGEVKDYVNYFQGSGISKEDANSRGLLARTKGERGFAIANEGSAELIAAHRADAFGDEAAFLITKNAPNNGKLQAVGIKALLENKTIATAINTMQAVRAISGSNQGSTDMFGFDDSAMKEAEQMASIVAKKQREIATRLSAISGAAKNPAIAKAEGIDIRDQDAVSNRIAELKQQKMAWDKWFENPEILAEVRQGLGNSPLQLQGETSADIQAKEKKQKAAAAEAGAEAKRIQEKENAETVSKEIAARSDGQVLELTPSEQVDAKAQEEIDKKEAEPKLAGQKDILDDGQQSMAGSVGATTKEQKDMASLHAANMGAEVVWQQGVYSLIRGYAPLSGDPLYMPTFGSLRIQRDISAVQGTRIPNDIKQKMLDAKAKSEAAADKLHKTKPFIKFDAGIATSENVSPELAGVLREWKNFLNIQSDIYISTLEDATKNRNKFTGPHRRVGSGTLNKKNFGSMRQMADGSYYILFTDSTSITKMLETIAHELGHIHEKTHFNNASPQERTALFDEHKNWLSQQKGKTAEDLVKSLRPRSIGRATTIPSEMMADTITNPLYWKSFGEWYADQTAKWAVSSKAPVGIVEKYFKRLGQALRIFFQTLKAQKYLPTETFSKYMEAVTNRPAELSPDSNSAEAQSMQQGFDFEEESNKTDKEAAKAPAESAALHAMEQTPAAEKKVIRGRSPELQAAAQMVKNGTLTAAKFDELINKYQPITVYTKPLTPATTARMLEVIPSDKASKVNPVIAANTEVGLRIDIPSWKDGKGAWVVSIHNKRTPSVVGKIIGYASVGSVVDVKFVVGNQMQSLEVATGEGKKPLQTIEGKYVSITPEMATMRSMLALTDPAWTQIGLDPTRHSYFYDRRTTMPVVSAKEVIQIGNMVVGKNVVYGKKEDFLYDISEQPDDTEVRVSVPRTQAERIDEYARLRRQESHLQKKVREIGSTLDSQRLLNELHERVTELKEALNSQKQKNTTPENFLNQARKAFDGEFPFKKETMSAEVFAVIQAAYQNTPWLLNGLRLSVKKPNEAKYTGSFSAFARIVGLYSGKGTTNPSVVEHELAHSLEQMMTPAQRQLVINEWYKALQHQIKTNLDPKAQIYFGKVLDFLASPSNATLEKATDALPGYDLYQYSNPSEYWAVNAQPLMAKQLGTAWDKFKKAIARLFEGLKSVLGFNNNYVVHKVFNDIVKGDHKRVTRSSLVNMLEATGLTPTLLYNIQDENIVKKYNRAEVPDANNDTIKETVLKAAKKTKDVFIEATLHPVNTTTSALVGMDRALLGARNREVFFGAALNAADIARYGGQLRTSAGLATASLALDNAIRGNIIATQVIFQGGLVYDSKTMTYRAEKTKLGMHGVYREEAKLKKKLGKKLGMQIIQGYLEAKRSQSILDELEARELEVQMQRQAVAAMTNKAGVTPAVLAKATANLQDAEAGLTAIKRVEKKINMSPDEITEFLDREKDHPELRNIMDNFNAINQNLLSFWLDVGLLSKGRYEVLSKIQDYVPWHRIMEDDVNPENTEPTSPMLSSTRSMTNIGREKIMRDGKPEVKKTFKVKIGQRIFKVKPSSDVFVEINGQALPSGAYRFTSDGNVIINSLIPLAVGDRVVITTNREIENMIDNMTRSVMRMTLNGVRQQAARRTVSEYADRDEKYRIIVYPKAERTKTSNRFSYIANGKPIIVGIEDKLISDAIYGLDTISLTSSNLMSAASNFIRRSITLSGVFQVKQVIKDAPSAAMVIKPKSPFLLIGGVYKGFVTATLRPIVNSVGKKFNSNFDIEPVVEVLLKNGIGGFHNAARTPEKEIKINLGIMNNTVAGYAVKFLDHIGDSSDVAQRVAVYKRVLKETGDETQALFHAANVINFLHRGYGGEAQFLVKNVAFIGAWANALDVLSQSMAGGGFKLAQKNKDPKGRLASQAQFLATAAKLSAATLAYCFLVGDDDEYRNLDDKSKYYNLMIPGTKIMLPMNTTAGFIFKVLPEALYNHYIDSSASTPHDRTRLATSLRHAFLDMIAGPDPIPSGIKPILEIAINYNFHTGKPLTPVSLKKDIAEEQYTGSTSELGKAISGMTGNKAIFGDKRLLNPIEADHIVRSLFGSIGSTVMWASNLMGEAALIRPTMTDKQTPIIGPLMRNEVGRNREDLFYDFKARVEQKVQTLNTMESRDKNTREFEREYRKLLSFQKEIAKTQKDLDEINKEIREYETSVRMGPSPDTRANKIINLQREKHQVLRGIERDRVEAGL